MSSFILLKPYRTGTVVATSNSSQQQQQPKPQAREAPKPKRYVWSKSLDRSKQQLDQLHRQLHQAAVACVEIAKQDIEHVLEPFEVEAEHDDEPSEKSNEATTYKKRRGPYYEDLL